MDWLAHTKFYPPQLRPDTLARPHLLAALRQAIAWHPLTLISAPAGYGKTTLLAQLKGEGGRMKDEEVYPPARDFQPSVFILHPSRIAWLSLDEGDDEPICFLAALLRALQSLNPACGAATRSLLDMAMPWPGQEVPIRPIVGALVNDVLEALPDPFVLVLDDLHLITRPAVYLALDYLLERLPPAMHVVIAGRHDPPLALARLRARGQLAELRLPDLRFTPAEAASLINDRLDLALSEAELATLYARTEGWPASLRLLAISLEHAPRAADRQTLLARLAQTDRYVFDFLAEEVLNRQTPELRAFLLQTSILAELTPELCQAVTGRADAAAILQDLNRRNLFIVDHRPPTTDEGKPHALRHTQYAYRYHALFAEFLRRQLEQEMPEHIPELHRRAAEAQTVPARAIPHYLAARDWEPAAQLIEQTGQALFQQGNVAGLSDWIGALPQPVREARPRLDLLLGECALQQGALAQAQAILERVAQRPGEQAGEALALLAGCALLQGDIARAAGLVDQALPSPLPIQVRVQLWMSRAWVSLYRRAWAQVPADAAAAIDLALERAAEPAAPSEVSSLFFALALYLRSDFAAWPDLLIRLEQFCRQAPRFSIPPGEVAGELSAGINPQSAIHNPQSIGPLQLAVEELSAFIHLWRGRLDEAAQAAQNALAIKRRLGGYPFMGVDALAGLAFVHAARGDYVRAAGVYHELIQQAQQRGQAIEIVIGSFWLGRTCWLQGDLDAARRAYTQMCAVQHPADFPAIPALRLTLRGLIEMAERRYAAAEQTLRQAVDWEEQTPIVPMYSSPRLALARLYLDWKRPQIALAEVTPLLVACERQNIPGLILKEGALAAPLLRLAVTHHVCAAFASRLLAILGPGSKAGPLHVPETGETLTSREVEVLRLLAARCSNREIADQLGVSLTTVKTHLAHLFQKLNVSSRQQAAARARDLLL